jgi:hypothetical protein
MSIHREHERLESSADEADQVGPPRSDSDSVGKGFELKKEINSLPWWVISSVVHATIPLLASLIVVSPAQIDETTGIGNPDMIEIGPTVRPTPKPPMLYDPSPTAEVGPETLPPIPGKNPTIEFLFNPENFPIGEYNETENLDREYNPEHPARGEPLAKMMSSLPVGGTGLGLGKGTGAGDGEGPEVGLGAGAFAGFGVGASGGGGDERIPGPWGDPRGAGKKNRIKDYGGRKEVIGWTDIGLEWLAYHQEKDGSWDRKSHESLYNPPTHKDNVGVTGLATLAFLGAGHTEKHGKHKENVQRAVKWLIDNRNDRGLWGSNTSEAWNTYMYDNAIGLMALAEAASMSRNETTKAAAQKAVDAMAENQVPYGGWGYSDSKGDKNHENDTSVTIWAAMAMKSAHASGLKVPGGVFTGVLTWVENAQDLSDAAKGGGSMGYDYRGGRVAYRGKLGQAYGDMSKGHLQKLNLLTSGAALIRVFWGQQPNHPGITGPCNILLDESLPGHVQKGGESYYALYYQTFLMFQKGGDWWQKWNDPMQDFLKSRLRTDGTVDKYKGSWDLIPGDEPTGYGGRVMSTSLAVLTLEVYYRYLQVNK